MDTKRRRRASPGPHSGRRRSVSSSGFSRERSLSGESTVRRGGKVLSKKSYSPSRPNNRGRQVPNDNIRQRSRSISPSSRTRSPRFLPRHNNRVSRSRSPVVVGRYINKQLDETDANKRRLSSSQWWRVGRGGGAGRADKRPKYRTHSPSNTTPGEYHPMNRRNRNNYDNNGSYRPPFNNRLGHRMSQNSTSAPFSPRMNGPPRYRQLRPFNNTTPFSYYRFQRQRIDRMITCPFLLRIYIRSNDHHPIENFQQLFFKDQTKPCDIECTTAVAESELQVYTWRDASLREIVDLVKDVCQEARQRSCQLSLKLLHKDERGLVIGHDLGRLHCSRPGADDRKTLQSCSFDVGDSISLAIFPRQTRRFTQGQREENRFNGEEKKEANSVTKETADSKEEKDTEMDQEVDQEIDQNLIHSKDISESAAAMNEDDDTVKQDEEASLQSTVYVDVSVLKTTEGKSS